MSRSIPKKIHQTWYKKDIPKPIQKNIDNMNADDVERDIDEITNSITQNMMERLGLLVVR